MNTEYKVCGECIYDTQEYQAALKKVKENNPELLQRQKEHNEYKRKHKKNCNICYNLCLTLITIAIISVIICWLFLHNMLYAFISLIIGFICATIDLTISYHLNSFWSHAADVDYELYKQLKVEFKKVGYDLP